MWIASERTHYGSIITLIASQTLGLDHIGEKMTSGLLYVPTLGWFHVGFHSDHQNPHTLPG